MKQDRSPRTTIDLSSIAGDARVGASDAGAVAADGRAVSESRPVPDRRTGGGGPAAAPLGPLQRTFKTALDYAVAVPALLICSPLLLVAALLIKLESSGPVLHRRRVVGRGGATFDAFKLRTMYADADLRLERDPALRAAFLDRHKLARDPRVTRVGRWLRRSSLDEVPQLLNVLAGQMSVIGPRMLTAEELPRYGAGQAVLLSVKPGLTGPWQVSGRADLDYARRVELDLAYVRDYSMARDLRILLLDTLPAVLRGQGAY